MMSSKNKSEIPQELDQAKDPQYIWDIASIFASAEAWNDEIHAIESSILECERFKGRLGDSSEDLLQCLIQSDLLSERVGKVFNFAYLQYYQDTRNDSSKVMLDRASQLNSQLSQELSFIEPELLALGQGKILEFVAAEPRLEIYRYKLSEIERHRIHTRNPEVEALLADFAELSESPDAVYNSLHEADMRFKPVVIGGEEHELSHGSRDALLRSPNREVRKQTYEHYTDQYLAHPQTLAEALTGKAKSSFKFAKARRFDSTLSQTLFAEDLSKGVFDTVLEVCKEHRPLFQRFFKASANILGIGKMAEYDFLAPLSTNLPSYPYDRAREMVLDSLHPLGQEYVVVAKRGLTTERWAHVFPSPGKCSNAFSSGGYGSRPFLLLNYSPSMAEVGTLAHELGHSMHSTLSNKTQPYAYHNYSSMIAETASNLNQVLLRDHILQSADRDTALAVLDEAFYFAHRYLFLFPTLSEVEHKLHSTYANGGALAAGDLSEATVSAFSAAYGDAVEFDKDRLGTKWAQFSHFYSPYYFFQYSIGISAAIAIGQRLLAHEEGIQEKYLRFLSAGSSMSTSEIFKIVDIDIASPEPYRAAFKLVEGYLEKLEALSSERERIS